MIYFPQPFSTKRMTVLERLEEQISQRKEVISPEWQQTVREEITQLEGDYEYFKTHGEFLTAVGIGDIGQQEIETSFQRYLKSIKPVG